MRTRQKENRFPGEKRTFARPEISHGTLARLRSEEGCIRFYDIFLIRDFEDRSWWIASGTVAPDLPVGSCEHAQLAHLRHGHCKFLEKQILIDGKVLHDWSRARFSVEILIGGEESLPIHQVHVILVVEHIGRADVQDSSVAGALGRTRSVQTLGEAFVQSGVLCRI